MNLEQFIKKNPKSAHAKIFAKRLGKTVAEVIETVKEEVIEPIKEEVVEPVKKVVKKKTTKKKDEE